MTTDAERAQTVRDRVAAIDAEGGISERRIGRPTGSTLPDDVQAWIRAQLEAGHSVNAIAIELGVSHDAVRVVRDGRARTRP